MLSSQRYCVKSADSTRKDEQPEVLKAFHWHRDALTPIERKGFAHIIYL